MFSLGPGTPVACLTHLHYASRKKCRERNKISQEIHAFFFPNQLRTKPCYRMGECHLPCHRNTEVWGSSNYRKCSPTSRMPSTAYFPELVTMDPRLSSPEDREVMSQTWSGRFPDQLLSINICWAKKWIFHLLKYLLKASFECGLWPIGFVTWNDISVFLHESYI